MSLALIPDFSFLGFEPEAVPFHADPVLAAIERHEEAWAVHHVAPAGEAVRFAAQALDAARSALLATPCATRFGALALLRHLFWWLRDAALVDADGPERRLARARAADLALLLNVAGPEIPPAASPRPRTRGGAPSAS